MPLTISDDYFTSGAFAGALPGELWRHLTCTVCGHRSTTWASFREHRTGPECAVQATAAHVSGPAWQRGEMSAADRDALASLIAQLPDPEFDGPLATLVDLHA